MYRYLLLALVIWTDQPGSQAYFSEELGLYDDSTPDYETHPESRSLLIDDIEVDPSRNAVYYDSELWTDGIIPYVIDSKYPTVVRDRIVASMREIETNVNVKGHTDCIHFVPRLHQVNYIYVLPRSTSCSSQIGCTHRGKQEVSIGKGCERKGIIIHELTHAIGFWHEHTRPDRDNYVSIDIQNVDSSHRHNYDKHTHSRTLHTSYDYASVMHYNAYEFALDRTKPAMTPKRSVPDGAKMGQRLQHSTIDVLKIQRLYKCHEDTSHIVQWLSSPDDHCDFAKGLCKWTQDTHDQFDWTVQSGHSSSGPGAGITTGVDNYLIAKASGHSSKHARIRSKIYTARKLCVDYWFFNHGSSGRLRLITEQDSGYSHTVSSYGSQHSMKWYHAMNSVSQSSSSPYRLVFEAYTSHADIAIDDINISEGDCT
ncbi:low choriolytic enzyme [Aplysia californica]|uniref:Metalloendopeptidase n=1 Tax=Aplysia californica TaxID=6500 RepID=A0ABM1A500_APLCA|nr:low choriolytic enzyme [Aplysia californica]